MLEPGVEEWKDADVWFAVWRRYVVVVPVILVSIVAR